MAISFVGSLTTVVGSGTSSAGGSVTTTIPLDGLRDENNLLPTLAENDLVVIAFASGHTADFTYTPPTGYTQVGNLYANDTYDINFTIFYKFMGPTPDTQVSAFPVSGHAQAASATVIHVFRGVDTTNPFDVTTTTATGIDLRHPNPPSITPSTTGAWIYVSGGSAHQGGTVTFTNPGDLSSTTNHFRSVGGNDTTDCTAAAGIKTDWTSGAFDPSSLTSASSSTLDSWAAITMALRPQGAVTHSVSATLTGSGTIPTQDLVTLGNVDATLSSFGEVLCDATIVSPAVTYSADATLSANGTVSADLATLVQSSATLGATGTVLADALVYTPVAATLAASGTLEADALAFKPLDAVLTATGSVNASANLTSLVTAIVTGIGFTAGDILTVIPVSKTLTATGTLQSSIEIIVPVSTQLNAVGTIVINGDIYKPANAQLNGVGTVNATTVAIDLVGAVLSASGTVTATSELGGRIEALATLTGTGNVVADGRTIGQVAALIVGAGTTGGSVSLIETVTATQNSNGTVNGDALIYKPADATVSGSGSVQASIVALLKTEASLVCAGNYLGSTNVINRSEASLFTQGVLQGNAFIVPSRRPIRTAFWI